MLFHQEPAQRVQHNSDMQPFDNNFRDKIANTTKICLLPNCHAGTTKLCPLLHGNESVVDTTGTMLVPWAGHFQC